MDGFCVEMGEVVSTLICALLCRNGALIRALMGRTER